MSHSESSEPASAEAAACSVLRHVAATLAYRAAKVLRDAPPGFASGQAGAATRRPVDIVAHMGDLMAWGVSLTRGEHVWAPAGGDDWDVEVQRFFDGLADLDRALTPSLPPGASEKLVQIGRAHV